MELARAEVHCNPNSSRNVRRFASIRPDDAETGVHQLFAELELRVPLTVHFVDVGGTKKFPYLKLSDWVLYLLRTDRLATQLAGCTMEKLPMVLKEYWARFKNLHPTHELFQMNLDLRYALPIFTHSDEGRSQKKEPLYVFSVHGALGRGTRRYLELNKHKKPLDRNEFGLNFVGQSMGTQCLIFTILKEFYNKFPDSLDILVKLFAEDCSNLLHEGVVYNGVTYRLVHVATKGDLPALSKIGHLVRNFSHCPRRPSTKSPCEGICHLCLGGQEANERTGAQHIPYEDLRPTPQWESSLHASLPWTDEPCILYNVPLCRESAASFFALDIWHCFHLGACKHWVGSSFVVIVESQLLPRMSIDDKFRSITVEYQNFCRSKKLSMWITEVSRDTLTFPMGSAVPIGKWNKGSCSTTMMLFLDHYCKSFVKNKTEDPLLLMIASSLLTVNFVFMFNQFGEVSLWSLIYEPSIQ